MEGKNADDFHVALSGTNEEGLLEGIIAESGKVDLRLSVQSETIGDRMAYFFIEIEDGPPVSFQLMASFRGPIVKLLEPIVDYGLIKINTEQKYRINLENQSPIKAELILKSSKNKKINFGSTGEIPTVTKTVHGN